jgi:hypothetical protein
MVVRERAPFRFDEGSLIGHRKTRILGDLLKFQPPASAFPERDSPGLTAMLRFLSTWALLLVAASLTAGSASAQSADSLFDEKGYDFGAVPRGQILTHPFRVVNKTDKTVQIGSVRVSCGCVSAQALQSTVGPGQETVILAQMNTARFSNHKSVTIYVAFTQPRFEEVRLTVQAVARDDVSFNPESLSFGRIKKGESPETSMTVTFFGGAPTRILEAKSDSNYVQVKVKPVKLDTGDTNYQVEAKVRSDTPAGKWYTDIWLKTDNGSMPKLRVPLTVEVEAAVQVNPTAVSLGEVKAGAEADRKVVLRSAVPFRITKISGTDDQVQVREAKGDSKNVHILTVTLRPNEVGELERTIRVHTDLKTGNEIEFRAVANVVP